MTIDASSRVLALIPARGGSKRIPRKNIVDFHGKPMIAYAIENAVNSGLFDMVHVSSDDPEIRETAAQFGADASLIRPANLSDDHAGLQPVARWVLETLAARGDDFDHVVILFPCAPLIDGNDLSEAWKLYSAHDGEKNLITIGRNPVPAEWLYSRSEGGSLIPLNPGAAFIRSQDLSPAYFEAGAFTIFSAKYLLKPDYVEDDTNYIGHPLPPWKLVDIDTPEDLEFARVLYALNQSSKANVA